MVHSTFCRISGHTWKRTRSYTVNEKMNAIAWEKSLERARLIGQWLREEKLYKLHEQERQLQTESTGNENQ